VPKPRPITSRSSFTYYSGAQMPSDASPNIKNVSYSITASIDRRGDGVIAACGDRFSGYVLYIKDARLVHDYNAAGTHYVVHSAIDVPTGPVRVAYRFTRTGELRGTGELLIDGEPCGTVELLRTLGVHDSPAGLTIGRNRLSAVAPDYDAPFPFDGAIREVVIALGEDRGSVGPVPLGAMD
jgi:arylsulfatase